jgi:hypothetical protein
LTFKKWKTTTLHLGTKVEKQQPKIVKCSANMTTELNQVIKKRLTLSVNLFFLNIMCKKKLFVIFGLLLIQNQLIMPSTSETGHAKNVANFQDLIAFVTGYGATYNPNKNALKLPQLNALYTASQASLADVVTKNTAYNNKVNERVVAFKDLKALSTRLINALQTTDATPEKIADAKAFNKKMQGIRAKAVDTPADPSTPAPATISTSQQSYDQQIQHLAGIISVLQTEPSYAPNETELQIATLTAKQADLTAKNSAVATAYTNVSNSRIARDTTIYGTDTGLFDIASEVKKYVKSVFGATSPQFAQIKGIEFTKKRR